VSTIQIRAQHTDSSTATAQVKARYGVDEVDDAVAVTIASWWQSPGTVGRHLAALASGAPVSYQDLADDIAGTRRTPGAVSVDAKRELDMLSTWAIQRTAANTRDYTPAESPVMRYASVVFQQGDDAAETLDIIDRKGEHAGLVHLAQWLGDSDPYAYETYDNPPHGSDDRTYLDGDLILTYCPRMTYAGLAMRFSETH